MGSMPDRRAAPVAPSTPGYLTQPKIANGSCETLASAAVARKRLIRAFFLKRPYIRQARLDKHRRETERAFIDS
jgi:hypothetical protein